MLYIYEMRVEDLSIIGSLKDVEVVSLDWNLKATCLWDLSNNSLQFAMYFQPCLFKESRTI
ncbi:hypothetical protein [Peribacillus sp. TH16]|nr:hypothetical protein [Peribacillus sp. TH16]